MLLHQGSIAETHENDEDDNLASLTWQEIAEQSTNIVTFESVIEEFTLVDPENEEDKLPEQLLEVANFVLSISLDIKVKNYRLIHLLVLITSFLFFFQFSR